MSADRIHLSVAEARALGEGALRGIGYDEAEACIVADHVIDAALCGYEYSGLAKILNIPEHRRFQLPRRPMHIVHETPVSALYDGGNNVGMVAIYHAARAAIAKAAAHGIAVVGFRPDLLVPLDDLKRELNALIARVKAIPGQPGVGEIRIPGEQSARNRRRQMRDGIDIDRLVHDRLAALAGNQRGAPLSGSI